MISAIGSSRRGRLLGPALLGFAEMFEASRGDPRTPWPYVVVVPSAVGPALLPFRCPHCGEVCSEVVDPERRAGYYDREGKFSWCPCPDCRKRFRVDRRGVPLAAALPAGATAAPSWVERGGERVPNPRDRGVPEALDAGTADDDVGRFAMLGAVSPDHLAVSLPRARVHR